MTLQDALDALRELPPTMTLLVDLTSPESDMFKLVSVHFVGKVEIDNGAREVAVISHTNLEDNVLPEPLFSSN